MKHRHKETISKNGFDVINCEDCGYWHVYPIPSGDDLISYYEDKYYECLNDNRSMTDKLKDPDGFYSIQYEDRLRRIENNMSKRLSKSIFDIGAGYGDFLEFMKGKGWEVQGIETSKQAIKCTESKELNIRLSSVEEISCDALKPVSVVTLNNVLEHVREPYKVIEDIRKHLLVEGGVISVIVPNDFSVLQEIVMKSSFNKNDKEKHYWLAPPEHLNYWSVKTIKSFLKKCGCNVLYSATDFPMEFFPLMGINYITDSDLGRVAHLKRVSFEKQLHENGMFHFKDRLFNAFSDNGIGRDVHVIARFYEGGQKQ